MIPPDESFRPPERRRVHEDVAEQLRDAILDGRFSPGDKLPPERELAERFQVNRTSLRQAISVLEGLGLVSVRQGDGATVLPVEEGSLDLLAPMIFRGGRIDLGALADATEVIRPLLLEMSRLAVDRCRPEQIAQIRRLRDVVADASLERERRFRACRDVVVVLSDMTHNRVWQMLARQTAVCWRCPRCARPGRRSIETRAPSYRSSIAAPTPSARASRTRPWRLWASL